MYHLIALYKGTYYYFGCACNHTTGAALFDKYIEIYPKLTELHMRWHPVKDMWEYIKDFKVFELFEKAYREDNL